MSDADLHFYGQDQKLGAAGLTMLPPPEGLDLEEISTDAGLFGAIEREAKKLNAAKKNRTPISPDTVRLITFLANAIQRRITTLSVEERTELQKIRDQAKMLEATRKVRDLSQNVQDFIEDVNNPKTAVRFAAITELEIRVNSMMKALGNDTEHYAELLKEMSVSVNSLKNIKAKSSALSGLKQF